MNPLLFDIPERLETDRLILRVPRAGDGAMVWESVRASFAELKPWMPWAKDDYGPADAEEWRRRSSAEFIERKSLSFLLLHDGEHVGTIGVHDLNWGIPKGEVGYWLRTGHHGQGLTTEAANAVCRLLFDSLKFFRVEIRTDDRNQPSSRVAERCGFKLEGTLRQDFRYPDGRLRDTRVYAKAAHVQSD